MQDTIEYTKTKHIMTMKYEHTDPEDEFDTEEDQYMNELMREREELAQELTAESDNFARSEEDGWYYSDDY